MRISFFFFLVFLFSFVAPAQAFAWNCPAFKDPEVNVSPLLAAPQFNFTLALSHLLAMAGEDKRKYSSTHHERPVGLTAASLRLGSSYKVTAYSRANSPQLCAQISSFTLHFGFDDTTVFVAREIPRGSCGFRVVLAHEMQHVAIDKDFVSKNLPHLPAMLRDAIRQIGVVRADSRADAEAQIQTAVNDYIEGLAGNLADVREKLQARIDTLDEYSRLSKSCNGEIAKLVSQHASR